VPDAILPPYSEPDYLAPQSAIVEASDVSTLLTLAETMTSQHRTAIAGFESTARRVARDTVALWSRVGMIAERAWRLSGGKDGGPVASDTAATWAKVSKVQSTDDLATRTGFSVSSIARMWDAYRSDAIARFARWQDLCDTPAIAASKPEAFRPDSAASCVTWSVADAIPTAKGESRTDQTGAVIMAGSNRGSGKRTLKHGVTVAQQAEADKAARKVQRENAVTAVKSADPLAVSFANVLRPLSAEDFGRAEFVFRAVMTTITAERREASKAQSTPPTSSVPSVDEMTAEQAQALLTALATKLGVTS